MRKIIGSITIAMLLMMPFLLLIPVPVIAQPTMKLSDAVGGGTGGTFYLNPSILYTGGVTISGDTRIYGQGAVIDLQEKSIKVVDAYLYIERCVLTNGTDGGTLYFAALEFYDGASGFVYKNIIVDSNYIGIYIEESSDIVIKENSIIQNNLYGIDFDDSTKITILENTIANNGDEGIYGGNEDLYDEDPNAFHDIRIKGNKIVANDGDGMDLDCVNGLSIASNLIYANHGEGIDLDDCPIVSITHNKILASYYEVPSGEGIYYSGDSDWPILNEGTPDEVEVELSLTISYNKIMGNNDDGIEIDNTKNIVITYNEIMWNEEDGIDIWGTLVDDKGTPEPEDDIIFVVENILIAYNTISGNDNRNIDMLLVSDVKILFNKITGAHEDQGIIMGGDYVAYGGARITVGEDILIKGNIINENDEEGIRMRRFNAPVIIEWNTILGNGDDGINIHYVESPQIIHNTIMYQWDGDNGIDMHECNGARIAYNTVAYNTGDNIYVDKPSEDVIIEYNTVIGSTEDGIEVDGCEDMIIQYNKIYDNEEDGIGWRRSSGLITNNVIGYSGSLSGNYRGIWVFMSISTDQGLTTISDNIIIGNYRGIYCDKSSDPTIIRNYIANNVYGIYLRTSSDPTIGGSYDNRNYIIRNYADGIYIEDNPSDPVINYNNIYGNAGYGISNWAATTVDDAQYNWWGAIDGPAGVGPGTGDEVTSGLDYIPWLTAPIP
ncbi:MAG: right-handed parallel beta-helix repeat-containing protein [archaeon]|nr:right-handed parallel beta-helix repeat-containing protein [archaeon]MCP8314346.1 right-handed parallel beta-helix repeat-containing protein [archaeon]